MYTKMKQKLMQKEIVLKENIEAKLDGKTLIIKGAKGELKRRFIYPEIKISIKDNKIILSAENTTKRDKTMLGTFAAHIRNMIKGVLEGFVYKLKICSGHFPMSVLVEGGAKVYQSFLEKNLIDKFYFFIAPKILGGDKLAVPVSFGSAETVKDGIKLNTVKITRFDEDVCVEGKIV